MPGSATSTKLVPTERHRSHPALRSAASADFPPRPTETKRCMSCRETRRLPKPERYVRTASGVSFEDEAFRLRMHAKIQQLLLDALTPPGGRSSSSSTNALLAKKVLKYRKLYDGPHRAERF